MFDLFRCFAACRLGGEHDFDAVARALVEHVNDAAVGHGLVGIDSDKLRRILLVEGCHKAFEVAIGQRLEVAAVLTNAVASPGKHCQVFVDINARGGLESGLLTALRQVHLERAWKHKGAGDHEEDEQQEDDVGHRCHAEHRLGVMLSF